MRFHHFPGKYFRTFYKGPRPFVITTDIDQRNIACFQFFGQFLHRHLFDRWRRLGQIYGQAFPLDRGNPVDNSSAGTLSGGEIHQDTNTVGFSTDLIALGRSQMELGIPVGVNLEMQCNTLVTLHGFLYLVGCYSSERDFRRRPVRWIQVQAFVKFTTVEHVEYDIAAADQFAVDIKLGDGGPVSKLSSAAMVFAEKPHSGCCGVPFMNRTTLLPCT